MRKWRQRYALEDEAGLADRSSRPQCSPNRLSDAAESEVIALRHQRLTAPVIARRLSRPVSTVGVVLRRHGLGRLRALDPRPAGIRYERQRPGELVHIDIKKLGRIDGVGHRIGKESAVAFTARTIAVFAGHGVPVERIMSDNGSAYRSFAFRDLLAAHGIAHKRTRPYTPRTNGKAERFIQTCLREWAYARAFHTSADRAAAMPLRLTDYNFCRPHSALGGKPPISRITAARTAATSVPETDPKPCFGRLSGVKLRAGTPVAVARWAPAATAEGGLGLTPFSRPQAQSATGGGDNVLGNDS